MRGTETAPARRRRLARLLLFALFLGAPLPAAADLSQSTLSLSPKAPVEGDLIRYELRVRNTKELAIWTPGATITAWYNPKAPRDVVVKRGYGGAYLFALLGLPAFFLGLWLILCLTRPRLQTEEETDASDDGTDASDA